MMRALHRLRKDRRGIALVEFAISAPILLALFIGCYQLSDAITCNRKVTIAARALADLTSQYKTIEATDVDTVIAASAQIMAPYDASAATIRVSALDVDGGGTHGKVLWSRSRNGSALAKNANFDVPDDMTRDSAVIMAEISMPYSSATSFGFVRPTTLKQVIYMVPRLSDTIPCASC